MKGNTDFSRRSSHSFVTSIHSKMFSILFILSAVLALVAGYKNELNLIGDDKIPEVVKSAPLRLSTTELPANFDYRPLGLLSSDLNQHIPVYW